MPEQVVYGGTQFMPLPLNKLAQWCHEVAREKGWWDGEPRTFGEQVALFHSELSELLEEYRNGEDPVNATLRFAQDDGKPVGLLSEAVDVFIRIFDAAAYYGWDLDNAFAAKMAYNQRRAYRHGGKVI